MEPAAFRNLDLDLRSANSLAPLAAYLKERAAVLYSGESFGEFGLTIEPLVGGMGHNPQECADELLATLLALPGELLALFRNCRSRVFDFGFDGGTEGRPCVADLKASHLDRMVQLGIDMRVTIYPNQADFAPEE